MEYPATLRLEVSRRLGDSWPHLADYLDIPMHDQRRFGRGDEPREIWEWLAAHDRLRALPGALAAIGRSDLSELLANAMVEAGAGSREPTTAPIRGTAVILTTLRAETLSVLEQLQDPIDKHLYHKELGTLHETGTFVGEHSSWTVAVLETSSDNHAAVAIESSAMVFEPDVVLLVGIASGLRELDLGDVVVADAVYRYDPARGASTANRPRIKAYSSSFRLLEHAHMVTRHGLWQRRIPLPGTATAPRAVVKPAAVSDELIVGDQSAAADLLRRQHSDAVAVMPPSVGLRSWARLSRADALVIRGISDLLSDEAKPRDEYWKAQAARHAAAFAFAVLDSAGTGSVGGQPSRYNVTVSGSHGIQIGDHNVQSNTFR